MAAARIAITTAFLHRRAPHLALLGAFVALSGCKPVSSASRSSEPVKLAERPKRAEPTIHEQPLGGVAARPAEPVLVKEGTLPLVYLADTKAVVRVVDRSDNSIVGEAVLSPRTILSVDVQNGLNVGNRQIVAGPLAAARRYQIFVVPDDVNVSRTSRLQASPSKDRTPNEPQDDQ